VRDPSTGIATPSSSPGGGAEALDAAELYERASSLPAGPEQRELGRKVLALLHESNAASFVALATRMALSAGKGLGTAAVRARVALVTELPIAVGLSDGPLALALASREELARVWFTRGSTGSLATRRLAARLLERAAREAARRAQAGDAQALGVLSTDAIKEAWARLLGDRESLVWRHVAVARGLVAPWAANLRAEIDAALGAELSPTEWRRAATSLAAMIAVSPADALGAARKAISEGAVRRDPGVATAFVWGLARAAEAEPEAAARLLGDVLEQATPEAAEAVHELGAELGETRFTNDAFARARSMLETRSAAFASAPDPERAVPVDDGAEALVRELARDLAPSPAGGAAVHAHVQRALLLYVTEGARAAYDEARRVLTALGAQMDTLDAVSNGDDPASTSPASATARRASFAALRDLDMALLERNVVSDLLHLGPASESARDELTLDALRQRLSGWILARESTPLPPSGHVVIVGGERRPAAVTPSHPALRLRRIGALLHLVDGDVDDDADAEAAARMKLRWVRTAKALFGRYEEDPPSILRGTILAALARALDALVRAEVCEVADVLLAVTHRLADPSELETLAEASMAPALVHVLSTYAGFVRGASTPGMTSRTKLHDSLLPPSVPLSTAMPNLTAKLAALDAFLRGLPIGISARTDVLRALLVRLHVAMVAIVSSGSLSQLRAIGKGNAAVVAQLEDGLVQLGQLGAAARARLDPSPPPPAHGRLDRPLTAAVSRVMSGAEPALGEHVLSACADDLVSGAPLAIASIASGVVWGIADLPRDRPKTDAPAEHIEGPTLASLIAERSLDMPRALAVLDQVLSALAALHELGVAHRNLAPANIVVRSDGEAVLAGLELVGRDVQAGRAKPAYGAPEVWGEARAQPAAPADVYAFACVAYETLTGRVLFDAPDEPSQIALHSSHAGQPPPIRALLDKPGTAALGELLASALRRDPRRRPGAAEVRAELAGMRAWLTSSKWPLT
jgi:hypothetical protein